MNTNRTPFQCLEDLGGGPDQVADSLRKRGIRGRIGDPCRCPLARYLESEWFPGARVGMNRISWDTSDFDDGYPQAAHRFRRLFDAGEYPDLIELDEGNAV